MAEVALQYSLYGKGVGFPSLTQPTRDLRSYLGTWAILA